MQDEPARAVVFLAREWALREALRLPSGIDAAVELDPMPPLEDEPRLRTWTRPLD